MKKTGGSFAASTTTRARHFEVTAAGLGSQNAVCGGGRYDGLVELLGGPPTKGIGFAIGTDRAILSIQEGGKLPQSSGPGRFYRVDGPESVSHGGAHRAQTARMRA